jgi:hypothetical protein
MLRSEHAIKVRAPRMTKLQHSRNAFTQFVGGYPRFPRMESAFCRTG